MRFVKLAAYFIAFLLGGPICGIVAERMGSHSQPHPEPVVALLSILYGMFLLVLPVALALFLATRKAIRENASKERDRT